MSDDYIYNPGAPGYTMLDGGSLVASPQSKGHIIKFNLTLPAYNHLYPAEYQDLFKEYETLTHDINKGTGFVLYALVKELTEAVEQAVTNKRSKGGFIENHWGPRPSLISASGQVGVYLSSFGLTPFQVESEAASIWDSSEQRYKASTGNNLGFRKFRMLLDLFKMNGVIFDNIPNPDIYPSTYVAGDKFYNIMEHKYDENKSIINSSDPNAAMLSLRQGPGTAPGNVRAVLPIEMYVKDTIYTGFFETFNYQFTEDNPYTANYDFTFKAKTTKRTAIFFPDGTAGRKPYSLIINPNASPWGR